MSRKRTPFKDEAELCAALIERALEQAWLAYPETKGYDIVLARAGVQIGVQAKMHFNAVLLRQILPPRAAWGGVPADHPQHLAILLPTYDDDVSEICAALGIAYFYYCPEAGSIVPTLLAATRWDHCSQLPLELPDYIPDVAAGVPSPVVLTEWKIRALRLCAILEVRGYLTDDDFDAEYLDRRRWVHPLRDWLIHQDGQYTAAPGLKFPQQHPVVYAEILGEVRIELQEAAQLTH